jgi:hypothetical protein
MTSWRDLSVDEPGQAHDDSEVIDLRVFDRDRHQRRAEN